MAEEYVSDAGRSPLLLGTGSSSGGVQGPGRCAEMGSCSPGTLLSLQVS